MRPQADFQGVGRGLSRRLVKHVDTDKVLVHVNPRPRSAASPIVTVNLIQAGNASIVGFPLRPAGNRPARRQRASRSASTHHLRPRSDDVNAAMAGACLAPDQRRGPIGQAAVRETFSKIHKIGTSRAAWSPRAMEKVNRKAHLMVIREAIQIYEGNIGSLAASGRTSSRSHPLRVRA